MTNFPVVAFGVRGGSCSAEACGDALATLPKMVAASCMWMNWSNIELKSSLVTATFPPAQCWWLGAAELTRTDTAHSVTESHWTAPANCPCGFFPFPRRIAFYFLSEEHLFLDLTNFWAVAIVEWKNTCICVKKRFLWEILEDVFQLCEEANKMSPSNTPRILVQGMIRLVSPRTFFVIVDCFLRQGLMLLCDPETHYRSSQLTLNSWWSSSFNSHCKLLEAWATMPGSQNCLFCLFSQRWRTTYRQKDRKGFSGLTTYFWLCLVRWTHFLKAHLVFGSGENCYH